MMIGEHNRQHHPTNTYHPSSASSPNNNNYTTMTNHISSPLSHRYLHHHFHSNPAVNTTTNSILSSSPSSPLSINSLAPTDTSPPITPRGSYLLNDYETILAALSRYLPSNIPNNASFSDEHESSDLNAAKYSTDEFRMYDFKVRGCTRVKAHDWTECPFAHPGEKARRRDPRLYGYTGTACTDFRKGSCRRGDSCEFAHGVFECWLHPTRYRTQACKDGKNCRRRVCFFAHTADELRILSPSNGCSHLSPRGSMVKGTVDPFDEVGSLGSPPVTPLGRSGGYLDSSPVTPMCRSLGSCSVSELAASLRNLQLEKVKSMPANRVAWNVNPPAVGVGSPPSPGICNSGYFSLPVTPTSRLGNNMGYVDMWGEYSAEDGSVAVERVESGRELRAKMFEKLSKENPLGRVPDYNPFEQVSAGPDVGWVSELLK